MLLFTHPAFDHDGELRDGQPSPLSAERHRRVLERLRLIDGLDWREGREATREELRYVQQDQYLDFVRDLVEGRRRRVSEADFRLLSPTVAVHTNSWTMAAHAAGTVMNAVDAALAGEGDSFCVVRPGCHHAAPDRGEGFCLFNHTAIAARHAQYRHGVERVLIVDVDVHHGQGTQACFNNDPSVFAFSIHSHGTLYPRKGAASERGTSAGRGFTLNVPVEAHSGDGTYLRLLCDGLRRTAFEPGLVLVVAGMDIHRYDPVGNLRLSDEGVAQVARAVHEHVRQLGVPCVATLAGGYNLETVGGLVAGWVQAWREDGDRSPVLPNRGLPQSG
jgi:acetoin utilization deacetylase AcuC-like enzyme